MPLGRFTPPSPRCQRARARSALRAVGSGASTLMERVGDQRSRARRLASRNRDSVSPVSGPAGLAPAAGGVVARVTGVTGAAAAAGGAAAAADVGADGAI